jgi:hypothetical protein
VAVVNDSAEPWAGELELLRFGLTGEPLAKETVRVEAGSRSVARIPIPAGVATPGSPASELLAVRLGDHRVIRFFAEDPEVAFPVAAYDTEVTTVGRRPGRHGHRPDRPARPGPVSRPPRSRLVGRRHAPDPAPRGERHSPRDRFARSRRARHLPGAQVRQQLIGRSDFSFPCDRFVSHGVDAHAGRPVGGYA